MINRNDESKEIKKMVMLCLAAASCVLLVFLLFLYSNEKKNIKETTVVEKEEQTAESSDDDLEIGKKNLVSEDLDFWDMYEDGYSYSDDEDSYESEENVVPEKLKPKKNDSGRDDRTDDKQPDNSMNSEETSKEELDDGKHIKAETEAGSLNWIEILDDMPKAKYDFSNNLKYSDGKLIYSSDGVKSKAGIDVSKKQGTIDFDKVKQAGIDFAMIKVGSRGYEKGEISLDDKFVEYATGFNNTGIPIGVFFYSMAITDVEAVEEANYAVAACMNYNVKYPIAIEMDTVKNDSYRTNKMTNKDRTTIVKKFCDTVKDYGYKPAICAKRDYLLTKLNLLDLKDYDFWVKDEIPTDSLKMFNENDEENETESTKIKGTDYPYKYTMWQYSTNGSVNGIDSSANLNISFVSYEDR